MVKRVPPGYPPARQYHRQADVVLHRQGGPIIRWSSRCEAEVAGYPRASHEEDPLEAAGIETDGPGIVVGSAPEEVFNAIHEVLSSHRVWERFGTALS